VLTTEAIDGESCRYRLCRDTELLPITIEQASMRGPPFEAPSSGVQSAKGLLRFALHDQARH
jgi:type VI protein secretion system component VasA